MTKVELFAGASILFASGPAIVVGLTPLGCVVREADGRQTEIDWREIEPARGIHAGYVDAVASSVTAMWVGLSDDVRQEALDRQEVVLTIKTGFAPGHSSLARKGEPYYPFNQAARHSRWGKIQAMSERLEQEASLDRRRQRDIENGNRRVGSRLGPVTPRTISNWCALYDSTPGGLFALVDGRRKRSATPFESLDPEIRRIADTISAQQDGRNSVLTVDESYRRCVLALRVAGLENLKIPESTLRKYLSHLRDGMGSNPGLS